jgi:hypothetical protein
MDLAVFSIILPLHTHPSWTSQLAAMPDASCFSIGWPCSHYANFWYKLSVGGFPQFIANIRCWLDGHMPDGRSVQEHHSSWDSILETKEVGQEEMEFTHFRPFWDANWTVTL